MYFTSDSLEDVMKHIKENFKNPYFICSCELENKILYVTDEFVSSRQLNDAIYHAFLEAKNSFNNNDWQKAIFMMRLCGGENKNDISVHSSFTREQYDRMNELLGNTTLLEEISNYMVNELFIYLVKKL